MIQRDMALRVRKETPSAALNGNSKMNQKNNDLASPTCSRRKTAQAKTTSDQIRYACTIRTRRPRMDRSLRCLFPQGSGPSQKPQRSDWSEYICQTPQ